MINVLIQTMALTKINVLIHAMALTKYCIETNSISSHTIKFNYDSFTFDDGRFKLRSVYFTKLSITEPSEPHF